MFDGAMARVQNAATSFGAFLDSTLDCYSESIILYGLLWYALQHPDQHDQSWSAFAEQKLDDYLYLSGCRWLFNS